MGYGVYEQVQLSASTQEHCCCCLLETVKLTRNNPSIPTPSVHLSGADKPSQSSLATKQLRTAPTLRRENSPSQVFLRAVQPDQVHSLIARLQHAVGTNGQRTQDIPAKECNSQFRLNRGFVRCSR